MHRSLALLESGIVIMRKTTNFIYYKFILGEELENALEKIHDSFITIFTVRNFSIVVSAIR